MKTNSKKWRVISGIAGLTFFIIANFTSIFAGLNVLERFVTFIGVIVPPIMAGITTWRVLLPAVLN